MKPVPLDTELLSGMVLPQPQEGSKDGRGCVLAIAGSVEVPGAALLTGTAALRAGAGRLQIATVKSIGPMMGLMVPEALVIGLAEDPGGGIAAEPAATVLRSRVAACNALAIGPGMKQDHSAFQLTAELLSSASSSTFVLDAAALGDLRNCAAAVRACGERVVITPHAGEMAQILGRSRDSIEADPLEAAHTAAELLHAVVIMKGAQTEVVDPQGGAWHYEGGGVGLAASGSGDVLTGIVVGLLARGASPVQAALWSVFLHGEAGTRLVRSCGPLGFLARELPGEVPRILADVEKIGQGTRWGFVSV